MQGPVGQGHDGYHGKLTAGMDGISTVLKPLHAESEL